jgi:hypothetical protein
MKINFLAMVA